MVKIGNLGNRENREKNICHILSESHQQINANCEGLVLNILWSVYQSYWVWFKECFFFNCCYYYHLRCIIICYNYFFVFFTLCLQEPHRVEASQVSPLHQVICQLQLLGPAHPYPHRSETLHVHVLPQVLQTAQSPTAAQQVTKSVALGYALCLSWAWL